MDPAVIDDHARCGTLWYLESATSTTKKPVGETQSPQAWLMNFGAEFYIFLEE